MYLRRRLFGACCCRLAGGGGNVSILTRSPERWSNHLIVNTCEGNKLEAELSQISANAEEVIPKADLVLFCLPGFANESELRKIQPYLRKDTYVGTVFASSGFFFKALEILPATQPLFGFQRVPFISRIEKYGHSAYYCSNIYDMLKGEDLPGFLMEHKKDKYLI